MPLSLPTDLPGWQGIKVTLQDLSSTEDLDQIFILLVKLQQQKYKKTAPPDLSETPFEELKMYFQAMASEEEEHTFRTVTIQTICIIALELENIIPKCGIKFCPSQKLRVNCLNRKLVASLMASAFLCLFPDSEDCANTINFDWFYESLLERKSQQAKLRCILHYFERLSMEWEGLHSSTISFLRVAVPPENQQSWPGLLKSKQPVCSCRTMAQGSVDDASSSYLKVISSEKEVGGGVLHSGCLQEEVMFSIHPELIVSKLFMGEMAPNEAILAYGFVRYSKYRGYGAAFEFDGDFNDKPGKDRIGHLENAMVAIDSLTFKQDTRQQYSNSETLREINKAFAGFIQPDLNKEISEVRDKEYETLSPEVSRQLTKQPGIASRAIATSHWGCGMFGGDPQLKCVIQWLAASQAGCPEVLYYTMEDESLNGLQYIASQVEKQKWRVSQLAKCVHQYCDKVSKGKVRPEALFLHIRSVLKSSSGCVLL